MKRTAIAACVCFALFGGVAGAAVKTYYLNSGDIAVANGSDVQCRAIGKNNVVRPGFGANGFRCFTGGDYRGRYGFVLTSSKIQFVRYTGMNTYKVVWTKRQVP